MSVDDTAPEEDVELTGVMADPDSGADLGQQVEDILASRVPVAADESTEVEDEEIVPPAPSAVSEGEGEPVEETEEAPNAISVMGREFSPEQATQLLGLFDWAQSLDAEQATAVFQAAYGAPAPSAAPVPVREEPEAADPLAELDEYDLNPALRQFLQSQRDELQELRRQQQIVQHQNQTSEAARFEAAAIRAQTKFAEEHGLTEEDVARIGSIAASQLDGNQYLGIADLDQRFAVMLEHGSWLDPQFRESQLQSQIDDRVAQAVTQQTNAAKKQLASSVTSSSGSAPRAGQVPNPASMSREETLAALTREIKEFQSQGG